MNSHKFRKKLTFSLLLLICLLLTACGPSTEELLEQARNELSSPYQDFDNVLSLLDQISDQELPEVQALRNECYFDMGCHQLFMSYDPVAAAEAFAQCVGHSQADFYLKAAVSMCDNDISGTINAIAQSMGQQEQFHTADEWLHILQYTISSEVFDNMTLEDRFALEKTLQSACPTNARSMNDAAIQITEQCKKTERSFNPIKNDINNYTIDFDTHNELEDLCTGTGYRPKILIIRSEKHPEGNKYYTIAFDLMRQLPTPYVPTSLAEVNTILRMCYEYDAVGHYGFQGPSAYILGVEMWLSSQHENMGYYYYGTDSHQPTVWGPEPPQSLPATFRGEYLIADHPDIQNILQEMFSEHF